MPPGGQGGGGNSPQDNHMAPLWIIVGVFVFGLLIWYLLKAYLVEAFFYIKLAEISVIGLFVASLHSLTIIIHQWMPQADLIPVDVLAMIANKVGYYLMFPVILILGVLAVLLYFRSSAVNYHHTYNMKTLLKAELPLWPQLMPVANKNLVDEHIEKGAWAMSLTPMQFAKKHQLLKENAPIIEEGKLNKKAVVTVSVLKEKAAQVFASQIGSLWMGTQYLNPHTKALFAAFAARACNDVDGSRALLWHIAKSSEASKLDFSGTAELLKKHENHKLIKEVIKRHAYTSTVMASLLELARTSGVLASADFLWLKPVDRRLWFLLNSVGRQTAPAEISGLFAHWLAEKELERPVKTPLIEQAVVALEMAIKEVIYSPDDDEEGAE